MITQGQESKIDVINSRASKTTVIHKQKLLDYCFFKRERNMILVDKIATNAHVIP